MWFRSIAASVAIALGVAVSAQAQSVLADKIQAGDRKAALALIAGGANVNQLASSDPDGLERLAGMAHLNGIPVRVEAVATGAGDATPAAEPVPAQV